MQDLLAFRTRRERAGLLVVDLQEKLAVAMPESRLREVKRHTRILIEAAKILGLPLLVSEQYPKGIGPTVSEIKEVLPPTQVIHDKIDFSCFSETKIREAIQKTGKDQWIVCGMETHICVFQTVRDLIQHHFSVFVPEDAVISRTDNNREIGLSMMSRLGASIVSTESLLFDMLERAGTPEFKAVQALVK